MNFLAKLMQKPKLVIPASAVAALLIGGAFYGSIGRAPSVTIQSTTTLETNSSSSGTVSLAFLKTGRISEVEVKEGDRVEAGATLAALDAADAKGALNQAKGALELAKAQYASLNVQYANAKKQQDVLVENAYRVLLSSGLAAVPENKTDGSVQTVDESQIPEISGTYTCDREGSYEIYPYASSGSSGYSFNIKGLEETVGTVAYYTPQPIGSCGLYILFPAGYRLDSTIKWVIEIPNTRSENYAENKNAYDLALATRDQVLKQLETNLGAAGASETSTAQATIDAAEGAYEVALANYNNTSIVSPIAGTVTFVDDHLKMGENATANKTVITLTR
jgi:multidrug efflux pump subunit AcrA (membrane-fusion protein)